MKLLTIGTNIVHLKNFHDLISNSEIDVLFITDQISKRFHYNHITIVPFSIRNPFNIPKSVHLIRKIISEYKPDIIHIHQASSHAFLTLSAAKIFNIPTIVTAWGSDVLLVPEMGFLYKKMVKFILLHAEFYTSDSLFLADQMRKLVPNRPLDITLVNYGIDDLSDSHQKENIFYSNRLHKKLYQIDKIIIAFAKFLMIYKNEKWRLVIAGEGTETSYLKQLAINLKISYAIEFTGWLDNNSNQDFYKRSRFFVSIPESDATSISLLEAMSAGCIPIVSKLPANEEWINDGENGVITNELDEYFLLKGLNIDPDKANSLNQKIISENALKNINRKKFMALYEKALIR
jgi:L-malate glycosyltransferase